MLPVSHWIRSSLPTFVHKSVAPSKLQKIFEEVFGKRSRLPQVLQQIVRSYIPFEMQAHFPLPSFVNILDQNVLKSHLSLGCQTAGHLLAAQKIVTRLYETESRSADGSRLDRVYPAFAEVLSYVMQHPGQTVLEIGAASGDTSLLLSLTDVATVYVNDRNPVELDKFRAERSKLPRNARVKLIDIPGTCFDILTIHPYLEGAVDTLICRNVLHLFNKCEQVAFFKMVHALLKVDGKMIFTLHPLYLFDNWAHIVQQSPRAVSFVRMDCMITDLARRTSQIVFSELFFPEESAKSHSHTHKVLCLRNYKTHFKWKRFNFDFLGKEMRLKIERVLQQNGATLSSISEGSVTLHATTVQFYHEGTYQELFKKQGFAIDTLFLIDSLGHLLHPDLPKTESAQIGVICSKPKNFWNFIKRFV